MPLQRPFVTFAFSFFIAASAHAADGFTFSNPPGPHAVGIKIVQQYDRTRLYKGAVDVTTGEPTLGERARPMQTIVWYPAVRGGQPLTYRQYLETVPTEDDFTRSAADVKRMTDERLAGNAGERRDALLRDVARPMHAVREARAVDGKFPVVVYAPSYSAPAIENADLCEYLASQGYVVLASASLGSRTRSMTIDLDGVQTQAADLSYLIAYADTLPQADTSRVAAMGFSWGGLANVFAAAKDARIQALVSLDGSLRYFPQLVDGGKDASPDVSPKRVAVPLLFVGARPNTIEALNRKENDTRYSFMNEMKYSDVYILTMLPMQHADFDSYSIRMQQDDEFGDYTRDEISQAHSWVARYVRHFLDAKLKADAAGLAFIDNTPAANKMPRHWALADNRRKQENAPTLEAFVQRRAKEGFDKAIPVYGEFAKPGGLKLTDNEIFGWGLQLFRLNRMEQAREVFRLGVHLYPDKAFMLDGLAEMQAKTGQVQEAVRNYRRVLELDPKNADAAKYMKEHGNTAAP